ncbi:LLM class flavin-dependent oxidoreductase [Lysinibacter sp. HNR]|uniref:LLM class flavin-dependent oxidoreductase n=1 Tax=Lysinibacter sp. HNR TaxID=3031408 RepID=UPI002435885E|nr:LLM class flavin-dependent oxidoreductase [Lysinibacter sp. HNR]WGD37105.1 LLM class flavin-dependent oxidoreductase [Lysinibacter sp. HNR]
MYSVKSENLRSSPVPQPSRSLPFSLGIELDGAGAHPASLTQAGVSLSESLSSNYLAKQGRCADRAGLSYLTLEDAPTAPDGTGARLDAGVRAAYLAPHTGAIGLVPVADVVYAEPFHLQGQLASLDILSGGRAGWVVRAQEDALAAAAVSFVAAAGDEIPAEASEVVEVVRLLWDSWQDNAVVRDITRGAYFDRERLYHVRYEGTRFSLTGPAINPRPTQGHPVVFGRDGDLELEKLDAVLVSGEGTEKRVIDIRERAGDSTPVILELEVILDSRGEKAARRLAALDSHSPWESHRSRFVGSPSDLIDYLIDASDRVDGVRLLPAVLDLELPELENIVLPGLRRREAFTSPVRGKTLRETLGLHRPSNTFEVRASEQQERERDASPRSGGSEQLDSTDKREVTQS